MSFRADNEAYEAWLRTRCAVVEADLARKHRKMEKTPFGFLRATFFRWARRIEDLCPDLADAPALLGVGDAHIENFGTWRDAEGRLVWGVNDFDEAAVLPYAFDLVRLATSARLAPDLALDPDAADRAILEGYRDGLDHPRPTLLDEHAFWMSRLAAGDEAEQRAFWDEVRGYPDADPPDEARAGLLACLPKGAGVERFATRRKGSGGLGRPRFLVLASWRGGSILREAKALVPSAWDWARGRGDAPSRFLDLAEGGHRSPDPFLQRHGGFVVRRIAADARKIELGDHAGHDLNLRLLAAMGFDLGAVHAASANQCGVVRRDLDARPPGWLDAAARTAAAAVRRDHEAWQKR